MTTTPTGTWSAQTKREGVVSDAPIRDRLRILVVATDVDMAEQKGDAVHLRKIVQQWVSDHDLHIISATDPADCPTDVAKCVNVTSGPVGDFSFFASLLRAVVASVRLCRNNDYDFIYHRHDLFGSGVPSTLVADCPLILEVNGSSLKEHSLRGSISGLTARYLDRYERYVVSQADRIICVSPKLASEFAARGVPRCRLFVVENGCDTDQFAPIDDAKRRLDMRDDMHYVGFVGSLSRWHGLERLIETVPLVLDEQPCTRLIIVGDGPRRQLLTDLVTDCGLEDKVEFVGSVPHNRVPLYMSAFDVGTVLKHPSVPGSPLKLYEYLACGTPVLATNDEDFELLVDNGAGRLVEYNNLNDIADGLLSLLSATGDGLETTARALALEHTWERVAHDALAVAVGR